MTCTCINQRSVKRVTCHSWLSVSVWMWSSQDEGARERERGRVRVRGNIHNSTHWHTPLCQTTNPHVGFFCCGVGNCTYRGGSPRTTRVSLSGHQRALMSAPRLLFAALNNEKLETMAACLHIMYSNIYIFTPKPHTHTHTHVCKYVCKYVVVIHSRDFSWMCYYICMTVVFSAVTFVVERARFV